MNFQVLKCVKVKRKNLNCNIDVGFVCSLRSVWFTPTYTISVIIAVNGAWLFLTLCVLVYLLLHQWNVFRKPIWPTLTSDGVEKLNDHTKKFMKGVLRARHVIG